jgi:integral membrane sensor domain MASE1
MIIHNQILKMMALAGMYFITAWGASILNFPDGFSLPIYPAAGVALGAMICCGVRLWPGVFFGGLTFNLWFMNYVAPAVDVPVSNMILTSTGMSLAAVAQALAGVFLFNRFVKSPNPLNRTKDVLIFIFLVAAVSCIVCSFICLTILGGGGHLPWEKVVHAGITWWLGDFMGVLLVAPLFFIFHQPLNFKWTPARRIEALTLLLLFDITSQVVFGDWLQYSHYPLVYLLAPCLVWAAYRFGHPGTVIAILMISATVVWGTMAGRGPFVTGSLEESFALLQSYLLVLTIMTLILSAATTEAEIAQTQVVRFGRVLDDSSNEIYLFDE